jgi:hypothetical protein
MLVKEPLSEFSIDPCPEQLRGLHLSEKWSWFVCLDVLSYHMYQHNKRRSSVPKWRVFQKELYNGIPNVTFTFKGEQTIHHLTLWTMDSFYAFKCKRFTNATVSLKYHCKAVFKTPYTTIGS